MCIRDSLHTGPGRPSDPPIRWPESSVSAVVRTLVLGICLSQACRSGLVFGASDGGGQGVGVGGHGLLEEPVEQQAAGAGGAAVEPEGELVEVVVQLPVSYTHLT